MKRRKFLSRAGLSLPAALTLSTFLQACGGDDEDATGIPSEKRFQDYKVVVVGAGAAGLHAGWYLQARGFDVTILEASDRLGGRIKSHSGFSEYDLELGAENIYGTNHAWYEMVQESGAARVNGAGTPFYFFKQDPSNAQEPVLKSASVANQYSDFLDAQDFIQMAKNYTGDDQSVETALANTGLWNMFGTVNGLVGNQEGTNNVRLSIKGYGQEKSLATAGPEVTRLQDRTLLSVLTEKFERVLDQVQTRKQVKSIDYSGEVIRLTDQNGQFYEADRVVITVPLKILQDGDISFTPALPGTKQDAFQKIGMGPGMKFHLKFSNAFWEDTVDADLGTIYGNNFLPEITVASRGRAGEAILSMTVMGERAEQLASMGNDATSFILSNLDDTFASGNVASQSFLQGGSHHIDWSQEPYIRGAYSYPIVGGGLVFRKELAAPVDNKLFFAGEATHFAGHSGTVHGAIESSVRMVEELETSIV